MQVTRLLEAPQYVPPKHEQVKAYRLQGGENSAVKFCSVGLSYYEPGGRAAMDSGPQEKLYVVLSGELSISLASGEKTVLRRFDSCRIEPNESREVRNDTDSEAILLVIVPPAA